LYDEQQKYALFNHKQNKILEELKMDYLVETL